MQILAKARYAYADVNSWFIWQPIYIDVVTFCIFPRSSNEISIIHWAWKFAWLISVHIVCRTQFSGKSILSLLNVKPYRIYLRSLHYQVMSKSVCSFNLIIRLRDTKYFLLREMQFSFSHETSIDVNYIIFLKITFSTKLELLYF